MRLLYTIGIAFLSLGIFIGSRFNEKLMLMLKGRKAWKKKLHKLVDPNGNYIWFHCSSLGEFEQGRPVLESVKLKHPDKKIVLTFFSPSGYEIRKNYANADIIMYLPIDTKPNVSYFLDTVKPEKAFFVKYDYWYHFLKGLNNRKIPTYLISAIFRKDQLFFKWYGSWYRNMLKQFTKVFVQSHDSLKLLESIHIQNAVLAGDTRFDRVASLPSSKFEDPLLEAFSADNQVIVCGSTWPPDEALISRYILEQNREKSLKFIIAPHEIHDKHVLQILAGLTEVPTCRYTKTTLQEAKQSRVMVIDSIGKLSFIYRYGIFAYIGGGFGVGIHNTLEAAVYKLAVVFGPNYKNFNEACELVKLGAAFSISEYKTFAKTLDILLKNIDSTFKKGQIAGDYVNKKAGATKIILHNV